MNGRRDVTILLVFASLLIVARMHTYHEPLERDLALYAVIGDGLLDGRDLYVDLWDNKPPAVHVTYAVAQVLVGFGPATLYLLGVSAALATLLGIYVACRAGLGSRSAGLLGAALWTVLSGDLYLQANQPNTEVFINACLTWAFALVVAPSGIDPKWRRWLLVGLLFALASLYKHVAVTVCGFVLIAHVLTVNGRSARRDTKLFEASLAVGIGLAAWACVSLFFAARGHFEAFSSAVFTYNQTHIGEVSANLRLGLQPAYLVPEGLRFALPLGFVVAVGFWRALLYTERRSWLLLAAYASGVWLAIVLPGKFHPHYYQLWLPPLCIGFAWALVEVGRTPLRFARESAAALGALSLLWALAHSLPQYRLSAEEWSIAKYGPTFVESDRMGRKLDRVLRPDERFFQWGRDTGLYFTTHRSPPTGALVFKALLKGPLTTELSERVIRDLSAVRPELVVTSALSIEKTQSHPVWKWLVEHYTILSSDPAHGRFILLARRGIELENRLEVDLSGS